jgi:hypothetical protein
MGQPALLIRPIPNRKPFVETKGTIPGEEAKKRRMIQLFGRTVVWQKDSNLLEPFAVILLVRIYWARRD